MKKPLSPDFRDINMTESRKHSGEMLDSMRDQLNDMLTRMQTAKARKAVASLGTVKPTMLGKAALRNRKQSG